MYVTTRTIFSCDCEKKNSPKNYNNISVILLKQFIVHRLRMHFCCFTPLFIYTYASFCNLINFKAKGQHCHHWGLTVLRTVEFLGSRGVELLGTGYCPFFSVYKSTKLYWVRRYNMYSNKLLLFLAVLRCHLGLLFCWI